MSKRDKRTAPAEAPAKGMSIDAILEQLSDMKELAIGLHTPMDGTRVAACEAATAILSASQDEGINDAEQVRDLIHDYNALAEQYRKMHQRYEEPAQVKRLGTACLCPTCNRQVRPGNVYCWNCGKPLGWGR